MRQLLTLLLCTATLATGQDLKIAARSPYTLAKYIETHREFDWRKSAKALGISEKDIYRQPCEPCRAELIASGSPRQVIVIVTKESTNLRVFLRYRPATADTWKLVGMYEPFERFLQEQAIQGFGAKPFLIVKGTGSLGTGFAATYEDWFDLTLPSFKPVLSLLRSGHRLEPFPQIGRRTSARFQTFTPGPVERIAVEYQVEFLTSDGDRPLFQKTGTAVYARGTDGNFKLDTARSTVSERDIHNFYEAREDDASWPVSFLKFSHADLTAIERGPASEKRTWLGEWLKTAPDTAESLQLRRLLAALK